jgi:hypothetical protein
VARVIDQADQGTLLGRDEHLAIAISPPQGYHDAAKISEAVDEAVAILGTQTAHPKGQVRSQLHAPEHLHHGDQNVNRMLGGGRIVKVDGDEHIVICMCKCWPLHGALTEVAICRSWVTTAWSRLRLTKLV